MNRTVVFDPQAEITALKKRVADLEQRIAEFQRSVNNTPVYGPGSWGGWHPDSSPAMPDSFPKYWMYDGKINSETEGK